MPITINDPELEALIQEIAAELQLTECEALTSIIHDHADYLKRRGAVMNWLQNDVWPKIPPEVRGKRITRQEKAELLGYGAG
jgi:antitoxin VapB